jgi:hypothetical protein
VTTKEAMKLAKRAATLLTEASDMMHEVSMAMRDNKAISDRAYQADKAIRDAHMVIVCNYAGLIDTLKRESTDRDGEGTQ